MSNLYQINQNHSLLKEETEGESNIDNATGQIPYNFGEYETDLGYQPDVIQELLTYYRGLSLNPYVIDVSKYSIASVVNYYPTNCYMWYFAQGSATEVTGVFTLSNIDLGTAWPTYSGRAENNNGTDYIRYETTGNRVIRIGNNLDMVTGWLTESITTLGRKYIVQANLAYGSELTPLWLDGGTTDSQERYKYDSQFSLIWDVDGTPVDMEDHLYGLSIVKDINSQARWVKGLNYPKYIVTANTITMLSFKLELADFVSIFADFLNQPAAATGKKVTMKIYKNSTSYRLYTFSNCFMKKCTIKIANTKVEGMEIPYMDIEILAVDVEIEHNDGLASVLYDTD